MCIDGWYGTSCNKECPIVTLDNGTEDTCSNSSGQGVCESDHTCDCDSDYIGDACEFVKFADSDLESFICNLTSACNDDGHITPANLASLTTLDISSKLGITSGSITDLGGLRHATGLTRLTAICDGSCSSLTFDLSELENLSSLEYVNVSGTNMSSPSGAKLDFLPSSVRTLILDDVSLPSTTSLLSGLSVTTLSVQNNTSFAPTSTSVFPSSLTSLDISGCTSITDLDVLPTTLTELYFKAANLTSSASFSHLTSLMTLDLSNNNLFEITEAGLLPSTLIKLFMNHTAQTLLYHLSLNIPNVNSLNTGGNDCSCAVSLGSINAINNNKVCLETYPNSHTWYAVCASDSMTSYSDASTITCTRATNSSHSCIGGCAYGTECRSVSSTDPTAGECVEVLSDDVLHSCVSALFPSGSVHIDSLVSPVLLSVASLKTLVSVDDGTGTISPSLSCSGDTISDLAGIEHLTEITHIDLSSTDISDSSHLGYLSTLSNIESLNLSDCSFASLPDLHLLASLTMLDVSSTNISLPSATATSALLPANIVEFYASSTSIGNSGFSAHIASHLSKLTKLDLSN
ncbi:hypothetical protein ADUPG1_011334, partial [Aduncisulcus paluster]